MDLLPSSLSRSTFNILLVSAAFAVLFAAYNPLQSAATSLFPPGLGNQSLGTLYLSVVVTVFFGPPMVSALGARATMVVGAGCYVAYMATLIFTMNSYAVLGMSVVIGFGAAILWVALGVFIAQNSTKENYGRNTGIFWALFQCSNIFGNLGMYLVFSSLQSSKALYVSFTVIGGVGVALLLPLRRPVADGVALDAVRQPLQTRSRTSCASFWASVAATLRLLVSVDGVLLAPMYFFSGLELSFWSGEFTQLLADASVIGLVLTLAGVGEVVGGLVFGRLSDRVGRSGSMLLGVGLYAGALGLTVWMKRGGADAVMVADAPLVAYAAALLFGLADSRWGGNWGVIRG